MNPTALANFYVDAYGLQAVSKALEDPNFYVTDGKVTLVLAPWKIEDYRETEHRGPGLDHVGFKVESLDAFKKDVEVLREVDPEWLSPQAPNLVSEHKVVVGLLAACRHGQHQVADPEGNFLDVSE
jgi:catechol-2,3-dioxygenase